MRFRGLLRVVSSALLLLSLVSTPHPEDDQRQIVVAAESWESSGLLISEFYPCALSEDEYFSLAAASESFVCIKDWSVTDGEGVIRFVSESWVSPENPLFISFNSSSFWRAYGRPPDASLDSSHVTDCLSVSGTFRLADAGDSIALRAPDGTLIDFVVYGGSSESSSGWTGPAVPSIRKGEVAKRIMTSGRFTDTNSSLDWQPFREFRYGFTDIEPMRFQIRPGAVTAFASPDCSLEVLVGAIRQARHSVCLCSYEFSSVAVSRALLDARRMGVTVRLLVDGAPAGNIGPDAVDCLSVLRIAGCEVLILSGNLSADVVRHVGALHSKYVVIDSERSIVTSENFVEQGFPQDKVFGNRGWGVLVDDSSFSRYLQSLFDADSRRSRIDVVDWISDPRFNSSAVIGSVLASDHTQGMVTPFLSSQTASVEIFVSPDSSFLTPFTCELVRARSKLDIEQFQTDLTWESRWTGESYPNPVLGVLQDSARDGAQVRMILDSSWFNADRNQRVCDALRDSSATTSGLEAKMMDQKSPITSLHNKGAVVDRNMTLISSNNWVSASFAKNRELALLVESDEIASYFLRLFDLEWHPDVTPPSCYAGADCELALGSSAVIRPEGCSDDRIIASFEWDIYSDGIVDSRTDSVLFNATVPGKFTVVLKIVDSWGNTAVDELVVTVLSPYDSGGDARHGSNVGPFWAAPAIVGLTIVLLTAIWSRKRGRTQS